MVLYGVKYPAWGIKRKATIMFSAGAKYNEKGTVKKYVRKETE